MMNTKRGKGYFYSMGASDADIYLNSVTAQWMVRNKNWPQWAKNAYIAGYYGRECP